MGTPTRAEYLALLGRAVSRLGAPHSIVVQQRKAETEDGLERISVTRDPLLVMLRNAIVLSSSSGHGGGGSDDAKMPLNDSALAEYQAVRRDVQRVWQGLTPGMIALPKQWATHTALLQWHHVWLPIAVSHVNSITDEEIGLVATIFDTHRSSIEQMFNPPRKITLWRPCPRCKKVAVMITIDPLGVPRAACRSCNHVWDGQPAVMQLRRDMDDLAILTGPDTPAAAPTGEDQPLLA